MKLSPASAFFQRTERIGARGKEFASCRAHSFLAMLAFGCFGYVSQAAAEPVIFHYSLSAQPGDAISLQGAFSKSAKVRLKLGAAGNSISLPVETQREGQAIVQIPSSVPYGLYQVWVEDGGVASPMVDVNQAWGQFFVTPEIAPGSKFRLFGRNLNVAGGSPQAWLVNSDTGKRSNLIVDAAAIDPYVLHLIAPDDVQIGAKYDVYVSNGLAAPDDATKVDKQLTGIAAGKDHFGLEVAWAADLNFYGNVYNVMSDPRLTLHAKADGVTNDWPAIQAAIYLANNDYVAGKGNGGIVLLPVGTYKLDGPGTLQDGNLQGPQIEMKGHVVLQGAGRTKTILNYGYHPLAEDRNILFWDCNRSSDLTGVADLSIVNIDTTGAVSGNVYADASGVCGPKISISRLFIQNSNFIFGNSNVKQKNSLNTQLRFVDRLIVANSLFQQSWTGLSGSGGGYDFGGSNNFRVTGNTFDWYGGAIGLVDAQQGIHENNTQIIRDRGRHFEANFATNVAVTNNFLRTVIGLNPNDDDNEGFLAEGNSGDAADNIATRGAVRAAMPKTLQVSSVTPFTPTALRRQPVVAIVNGPGMGQARNISAANGNTLTLSSAWDVLPTTGSSYAIFNWGSRNVLIQGNTFQDGIGGGAFLGPNATTQVAIVGNRFTNTGGIYLNPVQTLNESGVDQFLPMYDNQIIGNTVEDLDGKYKYIPGDSMPMRVPLHNASIALQAAQDDVHTFGTLAIGTEIRGNSVTAHLPNLPGYGGAAGEGYSNLLLAPPHYVDDSIPAILGTIFQNNIAINTENAIAINIGAYDTFICSTKQTNVGNLLLDGETNGPEKPDGTGRQLGTSGLVPLPSVGTVQCTP